MNAPIRIHEVRQGRSDNLSGRESVGSRSPAQLPALTSIRGFAAWWIVLFHFAELAPYDAPNSIFLVARGGYLAVDLFFMLSGFVIALNYADKCQDLGLKNVRHFLLLRLARIYPLHIFMLLLFIINPIAINLLSEQKDIGHRFDTGYFVLSVLLVQNWGFTNRLGWNIPAWSISTEWFAYLAFPTLAWVSHYLIRRVAGAIASVVVLLIALAGLAPDSGLGADIPGFGLTRCVLEFSIGVLLFRIHQQRHARIPYESNACVLIALACFALSATYRVPDYVLMPLGFALLIHSLADGGAALSRYLKFPILEWIGILSYSTYLVHYFVKDWVKFLLVTPAMSSQFPLLAALGATAIASIGLYYFIEVPGRRAIRALGR